MSNLKQTELLKSLAKLYEVQRVINDGYHDGEIKNLSQVSDVLFEELTETHKKRFQKWKDSKR